jgi:hypothetical protein
MQEPHTSTALLMAFIWPPLRNLNRQSRSLKGFAPIAEILWLVVGSATAATNAELRLMRKIEKEINMSKSLKCEKCDCTIHGEFMIINGEIHCIDCAQDWMEDEFCEKKLADRSWYLQTLADSLEMKIWEAN